MTEHWTQRFCQGSRRFHSAFRGVYGRYDQPVMTEGALAEKKHPLHC
jgi:hypothetical protein